MSRTRIHCPDCKQPLAWCRCAVAREAKITALLPADFGYDWLITREFFEHVDDRELTFLYQRYVEEMQLAEIARQFETTREWVRQIINIAHRKLQRAAHKKTPAAAVKAGNATLG